MKNFLENLSIFLISFSFTFLIRNHVYFGVALGTGILILLLLNIRTIKLNIKITKIIPFLIFSVILILCSTNSILPERSFPVMIYLLLISFFSFLIFLCLKENKLIREKIKKYFSYSIFLNLIIVTIYNFINWDLQFINIDEIKRFKGYLNILTILVLILPFLKTTRFNIICFLVLIPNLILSNCNSAILGVMISCIALIIFYAYQNFVKSKKIFYPLFLVFFTFVLLILNNLPKDFDQESIQSQEFKIPLQLIDAHRQYIWSFSIKNFLNKPVLGHGPDTSNFIEGSQKIINSKYTGTMPFIPSHPHNFILELLLDIGLLGFAGFLFFIIFYNLEIYKKIDLKGKYLRVLFFFYFWGSSLVNFSFWLGWWQVSYYFITSLIFSFNYQFMHKEKA